MRQFDGLGGHVGIGADGSAIQAHGMKIVRNGKYEWVAQHLLPDLE